MKWFTDPKTGEVMFDPEAEPETHMHGPGASTAECPAHEDGHCECFWENDEPCCACDAPGEAGHA